MPTVEWFNRPVIHVASVETSIRFYVDKLGFTLDWHFREPHITVCEVWRSKCQLILCEHFPEKIGKSLQFISLNVEPFNRDDEIAAVDALKKKYAAKEAQIEEQRRRASVAIERETAQASQQKLQTGLSVGATILGALFGRKAIGVGSLGRATTAARGVGRSMKESDDIRRANENLQAVDERARALQDEIAQETRRITEQFDAAATVETLSLAPKRGQVSVQFLGLGWLGN